MNEAHLHLMLTHLPVVGTLIGLLILSYALLAKRAEAVVIALGVFVFSGLSALAVYFTGEAAEEAIEGRAGLAEALIEPHEEAALFALIAAGALGLFSLLGLLLTRRGVPAWIARAALVLALLASGLLAWTSNLGGQISHPEIRSEQVVAPGSGERSGSYEEADD